MFIYSLEHGRRRPSKEKIRRVCMLFVDDSTTFRRIGGFWYASFNKDFCRTLNDSKPYATLNTSSHNMVLLNGQALLQYHRPKQRIIVPEVGVGTTSEYRWSFRSAQFSEDVHNLFKVFTNGTLDKSLSNTKIASWTEQ